MSETQTESLSFFLKKIEQKKYLWTHYSHENIIKKPLDQCNFITIILSKLICNSIKKVPIILGGTKDEGAMYIPQFLSNPDRLEDVNSDFDLQGPILWLGVDEDDVTEQDSSTANIILREYLPGVNTIKPKALQKYR